VSTEGCDVRLKTHLVGRPEDPSVLCQLQLQISLNNVVSGRVRQFEISRKWILNNALEVSAQDVDDKADIVHDFRIRRLVWVIIEARLSVSSVEA
jgi:hypothetical protein